jgi:hypothetical protein
MRTLQKSTAESWMKAVAILLLLNGMALLVLAVFTPFLQMLQPLQDGENPALRPFVAVFVTGVITVMGALSVLLGCGLWTYRPWARITMIVLGWVMAAGVALALLFGAIGSIVLMSQIGSLGILVLLGIVIIGILALVGVGLHLWLFQFERTTESLFSTAKGSIVPQITRENAPSAVRGFAIVNWVSALNFLLGAILLLVLAPFIPGILALVPDLAREINASAITWVAIIAGIFLLLLATFLHFLCRGLWNFRDGARIGTMVLLCVSAAVVALVMIIMAFFDATLYSGLNTLAQVLSSAVVLGFELWFLRHPLVLSVFRARH